MTARCRQDYSSASEELPYPPGAFPKYREVDIWCQSIDSGSFYPLTPPDTISECFSDIQDMSQGWNQTPLREGISAIGANPQERNMVQSFGSADPRQQTFAPSFQPVQAMDNSYLPDVSEASVDERLSPVLSQSGRSMYTLSSFSEPERFPLTTSLDVSFATEPKWSASTQVTAMLQPRGQDPVTAGYGAIYSPQGSGDHSLGATYASWAPQDLHAVQRPYFPAQGGQTGYFKRPIPAQAAAPKRALLPRTSNSSAGGQLDINSTGNSNSAAVQYHSGRVQSVPSVSNVQYRPSNGASNGLPSATAPTDSRMPPSTRAMDHSGRAILPYAPSGASAMPMAADMSVDAFNAFIQYPPEEALTVQQPSHSSARVTGQMPVLASKGSSQVQGPSTTASRNEADAQSVYSAAMVPMNASSDLDDGRYRSHALYSRGPARDGLYYCPYQDVTDANCVHKPTKLKCNYDKYIDSHLKPFRCKDKACAKEKFSSTACLLRHEREAHGMHGHGDKPHLCVYTGCERSFPGNGFPRRYNLFDHMKRVHDHKEDAQDTNTGHAAGHGVKKTSGRKRKSEQLSPTSLPRSLTSPKITSEPPVQRNRTIALPPAQRIPSGPVQAMQASSRAYQQQQQQQQQQPTRSTAVQGQPQQPRQDQATQAGRRTSQPSRSELYAQWADRKRILARQMEQMDPENDNDSAFQAMNREMQELRRLSEEAQRSRLR